MTGESTAETRARAAKNAARDLNRAMRRAANHRAAMAIAGTNGGGEHRHLTSVPADQAGESYMQAADSNIAYLQAAGLLSPRQCTAAEHMARLYGIGGGRVPWRRADGQERDEEAIQAARREFADLLGAAPDWTQPDLTVLAMGEWVVAHDPLPAWRTGLDAVAARLKLAEDKVA